MPYIKEGSQYKYFKGESIHNTCYGWLSNFVSYYKPEEKQDYEIFKDLADSGFWQMTRGHHSCEFCGWSDSNYGNGEIWLKIEEKFYVFPRMIWHYVKEHNYGISEEIYKSVKLGKYEILTDQNIKEIQTNESKFVVASPSLTCRAFWKINRYDDMGEFFNKNHLKWNFYQSSVKDGFYIAELKLPPKNIEILFEDDTKNFPDQINIILENN